MKLLYSALVCFVIFFSGNASAFFFFWFPSGGGTPDPNKKCANETATVGQSIAHEGKEYKIKSIEGTSSMCKNSSNPILVNVELVGEIKQKNSAAKFDLDNGWEQKNLTDLQKSSGSVFFATNKTIDAGVLVSTTENKGVSDFELYVNSRKNNPGQMTEVITSDSNKLTINGVTAIQFLKTGKLKSGQVFTYFQTYFNSKDEIVLINSWTTSKNFDNAKPILEKLALSMSGLVPNPDDKTDVKKTVNPPASTSDIATKLQTLKNLFESGLIGKDDYEEKKKAIIKEL